MVQWNADMTGWHRSHTAKAVVSVVARRRLDASCPNTQGVSAPRGPIAAPVFDGQITR